MLKYLKNVLKKILEYLFNPKDPSEYKGFPEPPTPLEPPTREVEYIMLNRKRRRYLAKKLRDAGVTGNRHAHLYIPKIPDKQAFLEMCILAQVRPTEVLYV